MAWTAGNGPSIVPFLSPPTAPAVVPVDKARRTAPCPVKPATPRRRPIRPVAATVGVAHVAPASMKKLKQHIRTLREKDSTPVVRAGALLLMAGLLYLLWPSAEVARLALESVVR